MDTGKLTHTEVYAETFCFDAQGNFWASEFGPVTCWQRSQSNGVVQFTNRHTQVSEQVTAFSVAGKANWIATSRNEMSIRPANDPKATPVPLEGGGDIRLVLISPDEKWVVGAGHNLAGCIVFRVPANKSRTPTASESWNLAPDSKLTRPIFSNDGTRLALQIPGEALRLYRAGEWNAPIQVWGPATGNVAFTHDGRFLAACLEPGVISLIELETGESILKLTHPADLSANAISFTRDGQKLIFSTLETNCFYSWNLSAIGNHLESLNLDTEHLTAFLKNAGGESLNTKTMASSSGRAEKDWVDFEQGQKSKYALLKELRTAVADKNDARTMKSLEQLVEVDPNDPDICNRLAWRLCLKSSASTPQLQRALGLIGKSLAADRESPSYQHTFGLIAYRLGLEEALRAAQFARDHLTITNTAYEDYLLALIHLKQGQLKISSDAWTKAIANHLKHDPFNYELWSFQWEWIYKMAACSPSLSQKGKGVRPL